MQRLVMLEEPSGDVNGAERQLQQHEGLGQDMEKHRLLVQDAQREGEQLAGSDHVMAQEVKEWLQELGDQLQELQEKWAHRQELYQENWELQKLRHELEKADTWLSSREGLLLDPNLGNSVSDVEELLRKHRDLEKMLAAQGEKFDQLQRKTEAQIGQKLLEPAEGGSFRAKTTERRSPRVPSLKKRPLGCLGSGAKLNLQKRIPFPLWTPFPTIFSPLQTIKQDSPLQERGSDGEQPLGTTESSSASFLSSGTILGLKDPPALEGLKKRKERQPCLPSGRQLGGSPWKKYDGALQGDLQKLNPDKRKIPEDVTSPGPHSLAATEPRKLKGCFEREAAFYLRYSKSSEILLPTSPGGQAGLSLQMPSSNATLPEGFNLESKARPFSILSGNPAEKLPGKIILPRRPTSFKLLRKTGLLERAAQDFRRPPAPGCVTGPGAADERARGRSTGEKEKL